MFKKIKNIHMVGIGGSGMSGIAQILLNIGYRVTGSDLYKNEMTKHLEKLGARIYYGHNANNVNDAHVVVISTAIKNDNPEVVYAKNNKIPVIPRIEMLAELARLKYSVTIAGTHGKTTTTSMTAMVLQRGNLDPTVIIGGIVKNFGSSGAKLGLGDFLVAEADESDGSFLKLSPAIAIVTNIDDDHLDYYGNMGELKDAFISYMNKVPFYGCAIVCIDDKVVRSVIGKVSRRFYTYGFDPNADFSARGIKSTYFCSTFNVVRRGKVIGNIEMNVPGMHNVQNALAAIACGVELGVPFSRIKGAIKEFKGVGRRFEVKGEVSIGKSKKITVIDDYGHHPTEVYCTIKTIKDGFPGRRLVVIFQPHRYTRTKILYRKFSSAFKYADVVRLCEIYPAGEKPIPGVTSGLILNETRKSGKNVGMFNFDSVISELKPNDIVLTLGAGSVWQIGENILCRLKK